MNEKFDFTVVGSGPSGWAAILACLDNDIKPTLIDSDNILNSLIHKITKDYDAAIVKSNRYSYISGLGFKKKYLRSDFGYPSEFNKIHNIPLKKSFYSVASGGFSLVWGNAFLPFRFRDMIFRSWPSEKILTISDYSAILKNVPGFILNPDFLDLNLSGNDKKTLTSESKISVNRWGEVYKFGESSLALNLDNCTRCGLCFDGCRFGSLFETRSKILEMIMADKIYYEPHSALSSFTYQEGVVLMEINQSDGGAKMIRTNNLFLAAGALSSSIILAKSAKHQSFKLEESQSVTFPIVYRKGFKILNLENIELTNYFFQMFDNKGRTKVHIQTYPQNRIIMEFFKKVFLYKLFGNKISVAHMFLDSSISGVIELKLSEDKIKIVNRKKLISYFLAYIHVLKIWSFFYKNGIIIFPLLKLGKVGESYHFGSLSLKSETKSFVDSCQDQIPSLLVVDASAMPPMPPGPTTLSIMAYSYKVVSAYLKKINNRADF
jgi:ferredoxin